METDLVYYRRRLTAEETAATTATDVRVRQVHVELASRYAERVKALETEPARAALRLVTAA